MLNSNTEHHSLLQGQLLFQRLLSLKSRGVKLKIASSLTNSTELKTLAAHSEWLSYFHVIKAICYATVANQNEDVSHLTTHLTTFGVACVKLASQYCTYQICIFDLSKGKHM